MTRAEQRAFIDRTVLVDGHEYRILSLGAEGSEGKVYAHLASTTEFIQQRNGKVPRQIAEFITLPDARVYFMECHSLEDWYPGAPSEAWRRVEVVQRYETDCQQRLQVRILEGPERNRLVTGISPGNLRTDLPS